MRIIYKYNLSTINVSPKTLTKLKKIKKHLRHKTIDQTINYLLSNVVLINGVPKQTTPNIVEK